MLIDIIFPVFLIFVNISFLIVFLFFMNIFYIISKNIFIFIIWYTVYHIYDITIDHQGNDRPLISISSYAHPDFCIFIAPSLLIESSYRIGPFTSFYRAL